MIKTAIMVYLILKIGANLGATLRGQYTAHRDPAYHIIGAIVFGLLAWGVSTL